MKNSKQQNTNQKSVGPVISGGGVTRVKTEGRIGSTAPTSWTKGGLNVNTNSSAQSHGGGLAGEAAKHMGPGHKGGVWSDRAAKARAQAATPRHMQGLESPNSQGYSLKRVKPS